MSYANTYLDVIHSDLDAAGAAVNVALAAVGLPAYTNWFRGMPIPLERPDTPYAWYQAVASDESKPELKIERNFEIAVLLCCAFGAETPEDLENRCAAMLPYTVAALEAYAFNHLMQVEGWEEIHRRPDAHFCVHAVRLKFQGLRALAGVS
jgi:hypothetical protein